MGRLVRRVALYHTNIFFGQRRNLLDFGGQRRNKVKDEKVVVGLFVDVPSSELRERLEQAARETDQRIDALRARIEEGKIQSSDVERDGHAPGPDDFEDMTPKQVRRYAVRRLGFLRDARDQIAFLANHVIPDVVYRLDAEDARRLATLHVEVDG